MLQLEDRPPGHAVVQQVFRLQQTARPRARWQRVLGVSPLHPEARSWYVGAVGEIEVGRLLATLSEDWTVLHSVPLLASGTDVDHIAVVRVASSPSTRSTTVARGCGSAVAPCS